ncbi:uncharacterized protein LOC128406964 [Podarcis raffonei]|uniref:uncharacterized protein LOC128406964 n=1 Tax=Podarcis raffonei TaxID=65483 RepID=UPI002329740B|nr:uncharacterized protein LOC128406964 [Podarcis raffonei]
MSHTRPTTKVITTRKSGTVISSDGVMEKARYPQEYNWFRQALRLAGPATAALLTVEVLLLGAHDFVGRGLADGFGDGRAGDTVLRRRDPVRDRLARHVDDEEEEEEGGDRAALRLFSSSSPLDPKMKQRRQQGEEFPGAQIPSAAAAAAQRVEGEGPRGQRGGREEEEEGRPPPHQGEAQPSAPALLEPPPPAAAEGFNRGQADGGSLLPSEDSGSLWRAPLPQTGPLLLALPSACLPACLSALSAGTPSPFYLLFLHHASLLLLLLADLFPPFAFPLPDKMAAELRRRQVTATMVRPPVALPSTPQPSRWPWGIPPARMCAGGRAGGRAGGAHTRSLSYKHKHVHSQVHTRARLASPSMPHPVIHTHSSHPSLSLHLTHTHLHTFGPFLPPNRSSLQPSFSVSLIHISSITLSLSHTHTFTPTLTQAHFSHTHNTYSTHSLVWMDGRLPALDWVTFPLKEQVCHLGFLLDPLLRLRWPQQP